MRRIFIACLGVLLFAGYLFFPPPQAQATTCSGFHVWVTGETITAASLNAINTVVSSCGNNVDNTNIGSSGIFASQIKPTNTAQATFGGSQLYTFSNGEAIFSGADGVTPLAIVGNSATQSADLLDISQSLGGVLDLALTTNGGLEVAPLNHALNTASFVPPVYTGAGAAVAGTLHAVEDSISISLTGTCSANTRCTVTGNTFTLTNAAVFASVNSYACPTVGQVNSVNPLVVIPSPASGTSLSFAVYNTTNAGVSGTVGVEFYCVGT